MWSQTATYYTFVLRIEAVARRAFKTPNEFVFLTRRNVWIHIVRVRGDAAL